MVDLLTVTKPFPLASPQPQTPFAPQSSFVQRLISVQAILSPTNPQTGQPNVFSGGLGNTVKITGRRMRVHITMAGQQVNYAVVEIYGMPQSLMNDLSTLGQVIDSVQRNSIIVSAGDAISGMSPVFGGTIYQAYGEYEHMPDVPMRFVCQAGLIDAVANQAPSSFVGVTKVADMMAGWAKLMNLQFENNGVTATLRSPYYGGNVWSRVRQAARDVNIEAERVDGDTKLAIWPAGGTRTLKTVPLISPATGMIGYPSFAPNGWITVHHLFNPQVSYGGSIQVESSLTQASRRWSVWGLELSLDTLMPHGQWRGSAHCYPFGLNPPVPPGATAP